MRRRTSVFTPPQRTRRFMKLAAGATRENDYALAYTGAALLPQIL